MGKARSSESETGARSSALGGGALYDRLLMRLWCAECGRPSGPEAKGWRLYRTDDQDDPEDEVRPKQRLPIPADDERVDLPEPDESEFRQ